MIRWSLCGSCMLMWRQPCGECLGSSGVCPCNRRCSVVHLFLRFHEALESVIVSIVVLLEHPTQANSIVWCHARVCRNTPFTSSTPSCCITPKIQRSISLLQRRSGTVRVKRPGACPSVGVAMSLDACDSSLSSLQSSGALARTFCSPRAWHC